MKLEKGEKKKREERKILSQEALTQPTMRKTNTVQNGEPLTRKDRGNHC